jgi:hypothetical protein
MGSMMTCYACVAAAALCFALAGCDHPAESTASTPPADSFRAEVFEIRIGEAREKVNGALVTSAFFREAKVPPLVGRLFLDKEYQIADARVVVIAASFWQRRFGGDPALIGRTLSINQEQYTLVGILPTTFQFPTNAELWMPQNR